MPEIKEHLPSTYIEVGEVVEIDTNPTNFKDTVVLSIDIIGKDVQTIFVPSGYWLAAKMERWCMEGAFVQCKFEITKAGVTTYTNKEGKIMHHEKSNSEKLGRIRKASKRMISEAMADDIATSGKYEDISAAQATIISGILSR